MEDRKAKAYQAHRELLATEIERAYQERDAARKKYYAEQRELFYVDNPLQITLLTGRLRKVDEVRGGFEQFKRMVPDHMVQEPPPVQVKRPKFYGGQRAYYDGQINMPVHTSARSTVHEMGHWLEEHNPTVQQKATAFLKSRIGTEQPKKLSVITGDRSYKDYEVAVKDKFVNAYMGKVYTSESTEIISMGLEFMYAIPGSFARDDPETFEFVWNTVRGIG